MSAGEKALPLTGHLGELRKRLIRSVIVVTVAVVICFIFYRQLFELLMYPARDIDLVFIELTEMLGTIMRVSIFGGLILAMPYLTWEVVMFVSPALTRKERTYVYLILPWVALMFIGGVVFAYFVIVPRTTEFLLSFGSDIATPQIKVGNYINIVTRMLLAVGLVFEMPVLTTFLARIGVLRPEWLSRRRREAIIIAFVLAAIITPTIDPVNQLLVAAPLVILYEMSIWLAKLVRKRTKQSEIEA